MQIAHQLNETAAASIRAGLPPGCELIEVEVGAPWKSPASAEVMIAYTPSTVSESWLRRPDGWPGSLRWLHLRSSGIDEYPKWIFEAPLITCARGASAVSISEFIFASMLAYEKKIPEIWINGADQWRRTDLGTLDGKMLGLLGFGKIGTQVAKRALAFNMKIIAHRRQIQPAKDIAVEFCSLEAVLGVADHLVVAMPLTIATRGLLDAGALSRVKTGVHFVNVARGAIIEEAALFNALQSGKISIASLDVWDPEPPPPDHWIYEHPQVRLSPHIAASSPGTVERYSQIFLDSLAKFMSGDLEGMYGIVNSAQGY